MNAIEFLQSKNLNEKQIKKVFKRNNHVKEEKLYDNLESTFKYFKNKKYLEVEIIKMLKDDPAFVAYSDLKKDAVIETLSQNGFSDILIKKIIVDYPGIFTLSSKYINDEVSVLRKFGFSLENVQRIAYLHPILFSYGKDRISNRLDYLCNTRKLDKQLVIKMMTDLPALFGLSEATVGEKLDFYKEFNLEFVIQIKPIRLMQSVSLTYARYMYFISRGKVINKKNFNNLYSCEESFKSKYDITKEMLLKLYPYEECKKGKENVKVFN